MNPDEHEDASSDRHISTGGGAYVEGSVNLQTGDFVGRDKHVHIYTRSEKEELETFIREAVLAYQDHLSGLTRSETPAEPYKFLLPFGLRDQNIFFGRAAALDRLYQTIFRTRLTILHARSGAGKSSLLNAGLGPKLLEQHYLPIFARTYNDPVAAIINEIANRGRPPRPRLLLPVLPLREFLHLVVTNMSRRIVEVVIILDQFEEMFTHIAPESRQDYVKALADCLEDEGLPLRFVLAIRGDYFSELAEFEARLPYIFDNRFYLTQMNADEVKAAITQPVKQVDQAVTYDEALLETLLEVLAGDEMDLPELQILCSHLYNLAQERQMTQISVSLYQEAGGAQGILSSYLEQALAKFAPEQRQIAWQLFTELVDSLGQRHILTLAEIQQRIGVVQETLQPVLNRLVASRLLQRNENGGYDLAHDYLAGTIRNRIGQAELEVKRVRELLQREVASWQADRSLMARDRFELIDRQRHLLPELTAAEVELLCRSAVAHQVAIDIWALAAHQKGLDIWPLLQPALTAQEPQLRARVIAILPVIGEAALPALGQALADVAPLVRVTAIQALVRIGTEPAHHVLSTKLQDEVYIPPDANRAGFLFDRYPVTNTAYELFLSFNPSYEPPDHWRGRSAPDDVKLHPVVGVSWVDARAYAAWAGKRLPTTTEWQIAAGGQNGRRYPWGNEFSTDRANTREGGKGMTTPVGHYSPAGDSPAGAADLAGNVWEWLADEAGVAGQYRQLRGGSWFYSAEFARTDYDRFWRPPEQRQDDIGFRLCFGLTEGA